MLKKFENVNIISVKSDTKSTKEIIDEMKDDTDIDYIQPNFIYYTNSNDTDYSKLW